MSPGTSGTAKGRGPHTAETKVFAAVTAMAMAIAVLGLALAEPLLTIAGLAFALFSGFGVLFALAKERRWLE